MRLNASNHIIRAITTVPPEDRHLCAMLRNMFEIRDVRVRTTAVNVLCSRPIRKSFTVDIIIAYATVQNCIPLQDGLNKTWPYPAK